MSLRLVATICCLVERAQMCSPATPPTFSEAALGGDDALFGGAGKIAAGRRLHQHARRGGGWRRRALRRRRQPLAERRRRDLHGGRGGGRGRRVVWRRWQRHAAGRRRVCGKRQCARWRRSPRWPGRRRCSIGRLWTRNEVRRGGRRRLLLGYAGNDNLFGERPPWGTCPRRRRLPGGTRRARSACRRPEVLVDSARGGADRLACGAGNDEIMGDAVDTARRAFGVTTRFSVGLARMSCSATPAPSTTARPRAVRIGSAEVAATTRFGATSARSWTAPRSYAARVRYVFGPGAGQDTIFDFKDGVDRIGLCQVQLAGCAACR